MAGTQRFPKWVPEEARSRTKELEQGFPDPVSLARLARLAKHDNMKKAWATLAGRKFIGREGDVLQAAFTFSRPDVIDAALSEDMFGFAALGGQPDIPPWGLGLREISEVASRLLAMVTKAQGNVAGLWAHSFVTAPAAAGCDGHSSPRPDDRSVAPVTFDGMMQVVFHIHDFFGDLSDSWEVWKESLPTVRNRHADNGREIFFGRMVDHRLQRIYGRAPPPAVIAILTEVAFDLPPEKAIDHQTMQSRLRSSRRL
jgi:hypothetical protein